MGGINVRKVHLVYGPQTRVVPVRVPGGKVSNEMVALNMLEGERFMGAIGHHSFFRDLTPARAEEILQKRAQIRSFFAPELEISEMVEISGSVRVMKAELSVFTFSRAMGSLTGGYVIYASGTKENEILKSILDDPKAQNDALTWVNLWDALAVAQRLRELKGRKFKVPTIREMEAAGDRLSGENATWTISTGMGRPALWKVMGERDGVEGLHGFVVDTENSTDRLENFAIRLAEDF